jgi:hypothetical protein
MISMFEVDRSLEYYAIFLALILIPICFVRDLTKFAKFHILADLIILCVVLIVCVNAFI